MKKETTINIAEISEVIINDQHTYSFSIQINDSEWIKIKISPGRFEVNGQPVFDNYDSVVGKEEVE